ncbi:hypothetical protein DXT99_19710 [Pontibacter diazotrophicus]|uniref:Uncharacterized protein n=1 Tax=Pontibacter diazotrophicus TaxID=1400979 RepID=A0A3D8L7N6_9BACT|nr:hypothetical protein DXT99_19710 [Pontibacter diazotrophicus]
MYRGRQSDADNAGIIASKNTEIHYKVDYVTFKKSCSTQKAIHNKRGVSKARIASANQGNRK